MVFIEISVAMMCEDPEEHKSIRKAHFNERTEIKIDHSNKKFVSISLSLGWGTEEPGNYTHLILLPEIIH